MSSPYDMVHQLRMHAQKQRENETLAALLAVLSEQAEAMKKQASAAQAAQRAAWWFSFLSVIVAAGSLTVAALALVIP